MVVGKEKERKKGIPLLFQITCNIYLSSVPTPMTLCILTLRTPLDFYTSYTSSMKNMMCISPKNCFSDWKDAPPWFNQTMSFLALSLRPQTHQPQSTAQEWLIKRRKALAFLKPPSPIFSFRPHLSSIYDDLHSPSLHSFSPGIAFKLSTHCSIKKKGKIFFSIRLDSQSRM